VVIREPTFDRQVTWTGPGFLKVSERDTIEFVIETVPASVEYTIVVRYEPQVLLSIEKLYVFLFISYINLILSCIKRIGLVKDDTHPS